MLLALFLAGCATVKSSRSGAVEVPDTWPEGQWKRHTIDDSSFGPDGTRLADINGDGLLDITTPWEQGGVVRVYINPGKEKVKDYWPAVTVGEVGDPEDSFFIDLDGDGNADVLAGSLSDNKVAWFENLMCPCTSKFCTVADGSIFNTTNLDASGCDLSTAITLDLSNGPPKQYAALGWFEVPENARDMKSWRWHPLLPGGWFMTLRPSDIDKDGDLDILATDRKGSGRGALWLENPGAAQASSGVWKEHRIGAVNEYEALHNTIVDLDKDGLEDVIVAVKGGSIRYHRRVSQSPLKWETHMIEIPPGAAGAKALQVADINLDGQVDLVVVCEHATDGKIGTFWLSYKQEPSESHWTATSISGPEGFINDLVELIDLDHDGDLDVLTVEEKGPYLAKGYKGKELGVIWYENPAH